MKRQKVVNWFCLRCESPHRLADLTCRCMDRIPEHRCAAFRKRWWQPASITVSVTMESANR